MPEEIKNNVLDTITIDHKDEINTAKADGDGPLFQDIDGDQQVTEIESMCMNCHENVCLSVRLFACTRDSLSRLSSEGDKLAKS